MVKRSCRYLLLVTACVVLVSGPPAILAQAQPPAAPQLPEEKDQPSGDSDIHPPHFLHEIDDAFVRLPLAAALGAALALRPRRRGTPRRTPAVVQTQIVLAVVGALIMLVVGASLARAFAIVGAASLIRYRSKIDDPKDAVVMLSALSVGLAAGVGIYAVSMFATVFLVAALWIIESFEPNKGKEFALKIKIADRTDELRPAIEKILDRHQLSYEIRASSDEEVSYDVAVPFDVQTDRVTNALLKLDPEGHAAVDWSEKKKKVQ